MRRHLVLLALLAACSASGAEPGTTAAVLTSSTGTSLPATTVTTAPTATTVPPAPATATTSAPATTTTTTEPPIRDFFVLMPDGLVPGFRDIALALPGVEAVTVTVTGTLHITETRSAGGPVVDLPPEGFVIPVEARLLDAAAAGEFPGTADAPTLGPGDVVLGATSAEIRRLGVGDRITFEGGITLTVSAVLADEAVGSAEVILADGDHFAGARTRSRSARVTFDGSAADLEEALVAVLPEGSLFRVGETGGAPGRRGGLVRSQADIKQLFGEFAYRPGTGIGFTIDPAWVEENIVRVDIPLLGSGPCHRRYAAMLTVIMQSLVDAGLEDVIDRSAYRGCWVPRFIGGSTRISRHAYGAAADINWGNSPDGEPGSPVHPELLLRMQMMGMTSGHLFTEVDPGHFEWYGEGAPPLLPVDP